MENLAKYCSCTPDEIRYTQELSVAISSVSTSPSDVKVWYLDRNHG